MTTEEAERQLREWAAAVARRDDLFRAARRAGISKNRIHILTGVSRTTIDRIPGIEDGMTTTTSARNHASLVLRQANYPPVAADSYARILANAGVLTEYAYQGEAIDVLAEAGLTVLQSERVVRELASRTTFFSTPGADGHENTASADL